MIYLIGSLRNPKIPHLAKELEDRIGEEVFADWFSPGALADEEWQRYEMARGRDYVTALQGPHARNVFEFDKYHLDRARAVVLIGPAGKSAHLELGYIRGREKPGYILLDKDPDRWDVMAKFATEVCRNQGELLEVIESDR